MTLSNVKKILELPTIKPWGCEIEGWRSTDVAISYLHMVEVKGTSLQCHPNKCTEYFVVNGDVEVEFLAWKKHYEASSRVNSRPFLVHRTRALSVDAIFLELESPPDKKDLIRLEDSSNRKTSQYGEEAAEISSKSLLRLSLMSQVLRNQLADFPQNNGIGAVGKACLFTPIKILNIITLSFRQQITGNNLIN